MESTDDLGGDDLDLQALEKVWGSETFCLQLSRTRQQLEDGGKRYVTGKH